MWCCFLFQIGKKTTTKESQIVHCLLLLKCDFCILPKVAEVLLQCQNTCLMHFMLFKVGSCGNKAAQIKGQFSFSHQTTMTQWLREQER